MASSDRYAEPNEWQHGKTFFPRVRTPCGHGAQVIVEGREEQSDGGEKNKNNQNNPKPNKPQPTGRVSTIM